MDKQTLAELEELEKAQQEWKLLFYTPYPKQVEFHHLNKRERLFMAGNQLGKTLAGGAEVAFHLTGLYPKAGEYLYPQFWPGTEIECPYWGKDIFPKGWQGRRFNTATKWWVAGLTGESTRDNPQKILLGEIGQWGEGMIPKACLGKPSMARGTADLVDHVKVEHVSGKWSHLFFKTYGKGRERWQGETIHGLWFDEEPPEDVYSEGITRTNTKLGPIIITFTPLKGMSDVVSRFLIPQENDPGKEDRGVVNMTIDDAYHYTPEQKVQIVAQYPEHEREARSKGVPILGSGRVFTVPESMIQEDIETPHHWLRIIGFDFGWGDHPTAAVLCAIDQHTDSFHVIGAYREKQGIPAIHSAAIKSWGFVPVAWPHDGLQHDKSSGKQIAQLYREQGLNMLYEHSQYPDERGFGVEAGLTEMLQFMQTGRFKVARHLTDWFEEYRMYHRKEGRVVPVRDDLISATRYAFMSRRYATTQKFTQNYNAKIIYPNIGVV